MKVKLLFSAFILLILCSYCFGQETVASIDKSKLKLNRMSFYNYKFNKEDIEWQYEKMEEAQKNVDIDLLLSITHPDYKSYNSNGAVFDFNNLKQYWEGGLKKVVETIWLKNDIQQYKLNGDTATVIIHQQWKRKQWMFEKIRDVQTESVQRETWLNTSEGWKRWKVDNEHDQIFYVDGKRVDPTKPYNPDAPPFEPAK